VIVNARMYSATPAAAQAWRELLGRVLERAGLGWEIVEYAAPAPLGALWDRDDLGCAMMCGLPWSRRRPRPTLVGAPVPSPARYGGKPIYFTDIAVRAEAPFERLEDTFGGVVGYTLRDSMSGYVALRAHLLRYRQASGSPLYARAVGGFVNARSVIEALAAGTIDVGPLDSYYHDLLKRGDAELAAKVRTIASTPAAPIPPFVATGMVAKADLARLRGALDAASTAPELAAQRAALLLDRFSVPAESDYDALASVLDAATRYPDAW